MRGVFAIETETCEKLIAICYPLWNCDIAYPTAELGELTQYDRSRGVNDALAFLFFTEKPGCHAVFELWQSYPDEIQASGIINMPAVMNAIWKHYPMYAAAYNSREKQGLNDTTGLLLQCFGMEVDLKSSVDNTIAFSPDAGMDYLNF